jgi:hypothetical protein
VPLNLGATACGMWVVLGVERMWSDDARRT